MLQPHDVPAFPLPLSAYAPTGDGLFGTLLARIEAEPLNAVATVIFLLAVVHTLFAARVTDAAHRLQAQRNVDALAAGMPPTQSVAAELLHLFGEIEVIFGLWVVPLGVVIGLSRGWTLATHYLNDTVNYTEPLFVVVIMALASTRPIVNLAQRVLRSFANLGRGTPAAWWVAILTIGPLLGSFITEPAAMTIAALLLASKFYALQPSARLKYGTLGLLFVNVSIGGTLTHFAAPPVLMVSRPWEWDTAFMLANFGWRAVIAIILSTAAYYVFFRTELQALALREASPAFQPSTIKSDASGSPPAPIPWWVTAVYVGFVVWTIVNVHEPVLFVGGFLFFLGFDRATLVYSPKVDLKTPLLVGFFLAGLVIHGGLQAWWIAPVLSSLSEVPLFVGSMLLTAFNDNALITYLATLVPNMDDNMKLAVVRGAVTGGGLTVIANAPNPAGQALLGQFFDGAVHPLRLLAAAAVPTLIAAALFSL
jgi:hypothetical protein